MNTSNKLMKLSKLYFKLASKEEVLIKTRSRIVFLIVIGIEENVESRVGRDFFD